MPSRRWKISAVIALLFIPSGVFSQSESTEKLLSCSKIKEDALRLKCLDEALAARETPAGQIDSRFPERGWDVNGWNLVDSKSPIDDSLQITATIMSEDGASGLIFRCHERKIDGQYVPRRFINSADNLKGLYRINSDKPVDTRWRGSTSGRSAFFNNATALLRSLPDNGKLFLRAYDFQGAAHDGSFILGKVSEMRSQLFAACPPGAAKRPTPRP